MTERSDRIRELNDRVRRSGLDGHIMISSGVAALGSAFSTLAVCAIAKFDAFEPGNDPYGEHDFGSLVMQNHRLVWKIDYYDKSLSRAADDPADELTCTRVVTVMLAEEY